VSLVLSCLVFLSQLFPSVVEANEHDELPRQAPDTHTLSKGKLATKKGWGSTHFHAQDDDVLDEAWGALQPRGGMPSPPLAPSCPSPGRLGLVCFVVSSWCWMLFRGVAAGKGRSERRVGTD
jgi:hypothetical protein